MFRFQDPQYLPLLSLIIILALLYVFNAYKVRHLEKQLADKRLLSETAPKRSPKRRLLKFVLLETALAFLVLMMARPQFGTSNIQENERGIEVSFIVDVSNSMMAQDILPNRLERSKLFMSTLIDRMKNDRVSLGVFAGEAYPQMPITAFCVPYTDRLCLFLCSRSISLPRVREYHRTKRKNSSQSCFRRLCPHTELFS